VIPHGLSPTTETLHLKLIGTTSTQKPVWTSNRIEPQLDDNETNCDGQSRTVLEDATKAVRSAKLGPHPTADD